MPGQRTESAEGTAEWRSSPALYEPAPGEPAWAPRPEPSGWGPKPDTGWGGPTDPDTGGFRHTADPERGGFPRPSDPDTGGYRRSGGPDSGAYRPAEFDTSGLRRTADPSSTWTRSEPSSGSWSRSEPTSGAGIYGRSEPTTGGWSPAVEPSASGWTSRGTEYGRATGPHDSVQHTDQRYFDAAYPSSSGQLQRASYPRYGTTDIEPPRPKDVISTRQNWPDGVIEGRAVGGYLPAAMAALAWYAVPLVLYIIWVLFFRETPVTTCVDATEACRPSSGGLMSEMLSGLPQTILALVLSAAIAPLLRWANQLWRSITVGFLAAVIGGGLATMIFVLMSPS